MIRKRRMAPWALCDLVDHLPADAALWSELDPDAGWSPEAVFLGLLVKQTAAANWQRGGGKSARPKVVLPWEVPDGQTVKGDLMTIDEARDWLGDGWDF